MPKVHLPDGRVVNFPDSMTPDQITHELSALATPQKSNTGMSTADLQAANLKGRDDLPSAGGFLGNVASSGGKFVTDAVSGIPGILKLLASAVDPTPLGTGRRAEALTHAPEIAKAAGHGLKQRYGGIDETLSTAYHDPVGMAADVSTVAGGAGLAAKAGNAPRVARVLSSVSNATNPMSAIGAVAEGVARPVARTVVKATLRPPAAVRADFGGSKGVADAVLKNRVYSEASAGRKLDRSVSQADKLLADAQAAGTPGVNTFSVAKSVLGEPHATAKLRTRLGVPDESQKLADTAAGIVGHNAAEIPLTEAQAMKREAQALAYEAGADNQTVKKAAEIAKAKALRGGIEARVPEVGPVNERSQQLLGAKLAFGAAEDRPRALTNFLSLLGSGGGYAAFGPMGGVALPLAMKVLDSPRAGAMTGIGVNALGKGANAASTRKAALIARLLEEAQ